MIRRELNLVGVLLVTLASATVEAKTETKVCVDVVLRAPVTQNGEKHEFKADAAKEQAQASVNDAASTADAAQPAAPSAAPSAKTKGVAAFPATPDAATGFATLTVPPDEGQPAAATSARPALAVPAVSAEDAASMASAVDPQGSTDPRVTSGAHLPLGQTPTAYLKRLIEHFVTHEPGFIASESECAQRVEVELYPLKVGWTAFARYSGTGREERVDQLLPTELSQFAERSAVALLHDVSIEATLHRDNVLWSDSLKSTQRIRGRNHFVMGVGTRIRSGRFDTLNKAAVGTPNEVTQEYRLFTPMALNLGYRGQFDQFGVEALAELDLGTTTRSPRSNPAGGHIDYGGSTGAILHVLRYTNSRGLASPYFGAGATFALHWFRATKAEGERNPDSRSTLFGGGLDFDLVAGYEFMRASAVSFFLQGELTLPAYVISSENNDGRINTWFPGAALRLGASF